MAAITLEEARRIAGEWRSLIARGVDPAVIEAERHAAEARERALRIRHSFTVVAEAFIADKLAKERSGKVAERDLRNVFVAAWAERPISEITDDRRAGNHQRQEAHRAEDGRRLAGPDQAVLQLGNRPAQSTA